MSKLSIVEYIWLDGNTPVKQMRSKTRILELPEDPQINDFPKWNFDGSSTMQAAGNDSDCILEPVCVTKDPLNTDGRNYLVLCEVMDPCGTRYHASNTRAKLRFMLSNGGDKEDFWLGFEQEYTMFKRNIPLGWPKYGFPAAQGPYYCGVGSKQIFGRNLAIEHRDACINAGLMYYGLNAEVMPGQWEFQIGYRKVKGDDPSVLNVADHTWIARWLLQRVSENYGIHISLHNKPVKGEWNGAGMHTNISTRSMRDPKYGKKAIDDAIIKLREKHKNHITEYGYKLEERLTGLHETSNIETFSFGEANRGASIRIPRPVALKGYGYIEDRRPGANADPYVVATMLISTICNIQE